MSDRIAVMNEGRIIQEGTPREIYTRPASVFASGFIGETNLIEGTVATTDDLIVTLAVGEETHVTATAAALLEPGTRATISVRPEAIRVAIQGSPDGLTDGLEGEIAEIVYLGSRVRIGAATKSGLVVWAELRDEEADHLNIGTRVVLSWRPSAASVWKEGSD